VRGEREGGKGMREGEEGRERRGNVPAKSSWIIKDLFNCMPTRRPSNAVRMYQKIYVNTNKYKKRILKLKLKINKKLN
jgi:hypothetical protein